MGRRRTPREERAYREEQRRKAVERELKVELQLEQQRIRLQLQQLRLEEQQRQAARRQAAQVERERKELHQRRRVAEREVQNGELQRRVTELETLLFSSLATEAGLDSRISGARWSCRRFILVRTPSRFRCGNGKRSHLPSQARWGGCSGARVGMSERLPMPSDVLGRRSPSGLRPSGSDWGALRQPNRPTRSGVPQNRKPSTGTTPRLTG
jgi:hypothetical protein